MKEREEWEAVSQEYPSGETTWGVLLGTLAQATLLGIYFVVTAPVFIPIAICNRVRRAFEPKPFHRGTVRPLTPITEKPRKAHAR